MGERFLHINMGSPLNENGRDVSMRSNRDINLLVKALKREKAIGKKDDITVVINYNPELMAGAIGRKVRVVELFRDGDNNLTDSDTKRYTVDF